MLGHGPNQAKSPDPQHRLLLLQLQYREFHTNEPGYVMFMNVERKRVYVYVVLFIELLLLLSVKLIGIASIRLESFNLKYVKLLTLV